MAAAHTSENAIELRSISKFFGKVVANNKISLTVKKGEILSLLGENGSGKTTLMNMLSGIYYPDEGHILIDGREVSIRSPKDAYDNGIGMIHQHFKLVDIFTAAENIALGMQSEGRLNLKEVSLKVHELARKYGFSIDPEKKIYNMSVSEKQTVEILKILYRGANILILDEPTAVLTPQETERLFDVLRNMRADGKAIIIITHKLHEVLSISDRVAVIRKGEYIGSVATDTATESSLTEMMVGKRVDLDIDRHTPKDEKLRLRVENLTCVDKTLTKTLDSVSLEAYAGEILGIAGIAGSGQKELLEAIAGLQSAVSGKITYFDPKTGKQENLLGKTPMQIREMGVALSFVPEDRLGMGLVGSMGMTGNMMVRSYREGGGAFTHRKSPKKLSEQIVKDLGVVTPGINTPVRRLSGGNVQKVLVGREIANAPTVLMTAYAVRGLDINTSYTIYNLLNKEKEDGAAVIYVGEDLDVLLALADRIVVLCGGQVSGVVDARSTTKEEVGLLMTKYRKDGETNG
ncbi:MAG: ABC transporter ATP-binding protein [Eubacteriales bacterium]|nr:ABC transporter ATP-binding protein [Eubacteriales bacterium]